MKIHSIRNIFLWQMLALLLIVAFVLPTSFSTRTQASATPQKVDTSCPVQGKARVAHMPALHLGNAQNAVYFTNTGSSQLPAIASLRRYDVKTKATSIILKLPATWIESAQVSGNGQWILLTGNVNGRSALQIVRIDGAYLQTLYCAPVGESITSQGVSSTQWSPDQKHIVLSVGPSVGAPALLLLTLNSGSVNRLLQQTTNPPAYLARAWLDNTRIYLIGILPNTDAPPQNLALLDIRNGFNQPESKLKRVLSTANFSCWDFDSSYNASQLFVNQCQQKTNSLGSGRIDLLAPEGGPAVEVFKSDKLAITQVRTLGYGKASKLLFSVHNTGIGTGFDWSQDGLWRVGIDGKGLTRLTSSPNVAFNYFTQYPWSNVSRNGAYFTVASVAYPFGQNISIGSLNGGPLTQIATHDGLVDEVFFAGWTTL